MRKFNTRGLAGANKVMHLAAIAYNLKKHLNFISKKAKSGQGYADLIKNVMIHVERSFMALLKIKLELGKQELMRP